MVDKNYLYLIYLANFAMLNLESIRSNCELV